MTAPAEVGFVHDTVACASPAIAETAVGGPGTDDGATRADGEDAVDVPRAFVAFTVKE